MANPISKEKNLLYKFFHLPCQENAITIIQYLLKVIVIIIGIIIALKVTSINLKIKLSMRLFDNFLMKVKKCLSYWLYKMRNHIKFLLCMILLIEFSLIAGTLKATTACTIVTISKGEKVFFGNNEDWTNPNTYIWFELPKEGKLGGIYFGFNDYYSQGGMNEKGLCFDANALPEMTLNNHPERLSAYRWVVRHIIEVASNISQVIQLAEEYNWGTSMAYQVHFADASGDAVVISPGTDGELNFTRMNTNDGFLVSTNFNLGYPPNGWLPCWRYPIATEMAENIEHDENLTMDTIRDILEATHQEGTYTTRYSNIFDLVTRDIYIYQNFNFTSVVKLNLDEELVKGKTNYIQINSLFPQITSSQFQATTQSQDTPYTPLLVLLSSWPVIIMIRRKNNHKI